MPYISISVFFFHISLSPSSVTLPICHCTSPSIPQPFSHLSIVSIYLISSPLLAFSLFKHCYPHFSNYFCYLFTHPVYPFLNAGEGHFQVCVHELWPLPWHAARPNSQRLLHVGRRKPQAQHRQIRPQREQLLLSELAGSLLARPLLRQQCSHRITGEINIRALLP